MQVRHPSGGSPYMGSGYGAFAGLSCMPNLAALRSSASGSDPAAGGIGSPGGVISLQRLPEGGASEHDLRLPSNELRSGSVGGCSFASVVSQNLVAHDFPSQRPGQAATASWAAASRNKTCGVPATSCAAIR